MGAHLDSVPLSGIIRIRDMMYAVDKPFRLDQGDVSFDAPDAVKEAMLRAVRDNRTHYLPTAGVPRLLELLAAKMRDHNRIPVAGPEEVMTATGGIHAQYLACQALLEPGDEVLVPDPCWPPTASIIMAAQAKPVYYPLHEARGWRPDLGEMAACITPKTKAILLCSPHNPTGGVLTHDDIRGIATLATARGLWVLSDEAYEDFQWDGAPLSIASLPGMHARTITLFTLSKTYAMTGVRVGYLAIHDTTIRARALKLLLYTATNVSSIAQYGAIGALEGGRACIAGFRDELLARRQLFFDGIAREARGVLTGAPAAGAFYAFLKIDPSWQSPLGQPDGAPPVSSLSWAMTEYLIKHGRVGCIPGVDFGPGGEGYIRFCYARDRHELTGALDAIGRLLQ